MILSTITLSKSIFSFHKTKFEIPIVAINISLNHLNALFTTEVTGLCLKFYIQMHDRFFFEFGENNGVYWKHSLGRRETLWAKSTWLLMFNSIPQLFHLVRWFEFLFFEKSIRLNDKIIHFRCSTGNIRWVEGGCIELSRGGCWCFTMFLNCSTW